MDFLVSQKQTRSQPSGAVDIIVDNVFDLYPIFNGDYIDNIKIVDGSDEIYQSAYFASIRQRGSDPLNPSDGCRWAEVLAGEVSVQSLIMDIKTNVQTVSMQCNVTFSVSTDASGNEFLSYSIQVVSQ
jgi:hypothetical protein